MPDENQKPGPLRKLVVATLRIIGLGYATVLVMLVIMETKMVFPGATMDIPSVDVAGVETVHYQSADATALTGQLCETAGSDLTVLYLHGNGITAARESEKIADLAKTLNANVLAAEYRGYDGLEGKPSESAVIDDCLAARDYLCKRYEIQPSELVVYGQSLGGGCAVAVAADSGARLLVLDRTFDSSANVASEMFWFVPVKLLMRNQFDSLSRIGGYSGPMVQMHGTTDRVIPIHHAKRLHEAANCQPKHWIEVTGMGHNDRCPPDSWQAFLEKITECLEATGT